MSTGSGVKRPFYLVIALLSAILLGGCGWLESMMSVVMYRSQFHVDTTSKEFSEADRQIIEARVADYAAALTAHQKVGMPLAAAGVVLGLAALTMALAALAFGRAAGRPRILVQVLAVLFAVQVIGYAVLREQRWAERHANIALFRAADNAEARKDPKHKPREITTLHAATAQLLAIGFRGTVTALTLLALLRRRTREYYEPSALGS